MCCVKFQTWIFFSHTQVMASPPSSYSLSHLTSSSSLPPMTSSPLASADISSSSHTHISPTSNNDPHSSMNSINSSLLSNRRSTSPSGSMDPLGDHHSSSSHPYSHYYYTSGGSGGGGGGSSAMPQLMSIREVEALGTPTASPILRPASGRFVGGT